jgi:CRISPR-associated protein Cmr5
MPAMIQVNGLGQTLAFYYASKKQMGLVYSILDIWVKERLTYIKPERLPDQELVEWVISLPSPQYKVVTMEIMALLNWLRRFADGMIKSDR